MRIGIDMDGVVADFHADWRMRYKKDFRSEPGLITQWDSFLEATHFQSKNQFWKWLQTTDVWWDTEPLPRAVETLHKLSKKHDIIIITSKPDWAIPRTLYWLSKYEVRAKEVHISDRSKRKYMVACDAYVDDAPHNLSEYSIYRTGSKIFRIVQPWNYAIPRVIDIKSLSEITRFI